MSVTIDEEKLYEVVKKAVSDVVKEEIAKLRLQLIPYVSDEEMKEIEELFGSPEGYNDQEFEELEL